MIIYQPWIDVGGSDGEYATYKQSLHLRKETAFKELEAKIEEIGKISEIIILKKGISEIEVIE